MSQDVNTLLDVIKMLVEEYENGCISFEDFKSEIAILYEDD